MKNPDPEKFTMEVAVGTKAEARADAPDVVVPFCKAHRTWPCRYCGTSHFKGCECPCCVEPTAPKYRVFELSAHERAQIAINEAFAALRALNACLHKLKNQ